MTSGSLEIPKELFEDPIDEPEIALRMAKWLCLQELNLPFSQEMKINICRNAIPQNNFYGGISKAWSAQHGDKRGICKGDIELAAELAGVYEVIYPLLDVG